VLPAEMEFTQRFIRSSETRQLWDTTPSDQNQHSKLRQTPQQQEAQGKLCYLE